MTPKPTTPRSVGQVEPNSTRHIPAPTSLRDDLGTTDRKLAALETEVAVQRAEIRSLKEQVGQLERLFAAIGRKEG